MIVGPLGARHVAQRLPAGIARERAEVGLRAREHHPGRSRGVRRIVAAAALDARLEPGVAREGGEHAVEAHVPVGDVHRHHAGGRELAQVDRERLAREQVRGDRVGAEGVEDDQLEAKGLEVATRLAEGAQTSIRFTKYALNNWLRMMGPSFDASTALEMLGFLGPDVKEGLASHLEKRKPKFDPYSPL